MQILKKKLAFHRTSQRLRALWTEYLQVSESIHEIDDARLRTLSSFMENLLGSDLQVSSVMDHLFDDATVIIIGLLDVVQRSSLLVLTEKNNEMNGVDLVLLSEAIRKALVVVELCFREEKIRHKMRNVTDLMSRILSILQHVESEEDKVLTLKVLAYVLPSKERQQEFYKLKGFIILCEQMNLNLDSVNIETIRTLQYCAPASHLPPPHRSRSCSTSTDSFSKTFMTSNKDSSHVNAQPDGISAQPSSGASGKSAYQRPLTPPVRRGSSSSLGIAANSLLHACDSSDSYDIESGLDLALGSRKSSAFTGNRKESGQSNVQPSNQGSANNPVVVASSYLSSLDFTLAFSAVNDILERYTPLSAFWLSDNANSAEHGKSMNNNSKDLGFISGLHSNIVLTKSTIESEYQRINFLQQLGYEFTSRTDTSQDNKAFDDITLHQDSEETIDDSTIRDTNPALTTHRPYCKSQSRASDIADEVQVEMVSQGAAVLLVNALTNTSCANTYSRVKEVLLFLQRFLVNHAHIKNAFKSLGGYQHLHKFILETTPHQTTRYIQAMCDDDPYRAQGQDSRDPKFMAKTLTTESEDFGLTFMTCLLSLLFDCEIGIETLLTGNIDSFAPTNENITKSSSSNSSHSTHANCKIENFEVLHILVHMLRSSEVHVSMLGIYVLELAVCFSPMNAIALKAYGGETALCSNLVSLLMGGDARGIAMGCRDVNCPLSLTDHEHKQNDVSNSQNDIIFFLIRTCNLYLRISIIMSESGKSGIAFFVTLFFLYVKKLYLHTSLLLKGSHSPIDRKRRTSSPFPRCGNCESEYAVFECCHYACCGEGFSLLCRECDRVFHKAVSKRTHIRLPILSHVELTLHTSLLDLCDGKVRELLEDYDNTDVDTYSSFSNSSTISHLLCIIMASLRCAIDDSRVRRQSLPDTLLDTLLLSIRLLITATSQLKGAVLMSPLLSKISVDITHTAVKHVADDCMVLVRSSLLGAGVIFPIEPPEEHQFCCQRILVSLLLQVISRFYVIDAIFQSNTGIETLRSDLCCTRSQMSTRIKRFSMLGSEAIFALMISDYSANNLRITSGDKQLIAWLFREITVTALEVNALQTLSLLQWQIWLLKSSIRIELKMTPVQPKKIQIQKNSENNVKTWGSANRVMLEREFVTLGKMDGITYAIVPAASTPISCSIRIMILQELCNLLGGDDWTSILTQDSKGISSKIYGIPHASPCVDAASSPSASFCRIPTSKHQIQSQLLRVGAIETCVDIVFGELSNQALRGALLGDSGTAISPSKVGLSEIDIDDWWCALSLMKLMLWNFPAGKEVFDACCGMTLCTRTILPLISASSTVDCELASALLNFLLDLSCSNGSFSEPMRPFAAFAPFSSPLSHAQSQSEIPCSPPSNGDDTIKVVVSRIVAQNKSIVACSNVNISKLCPLYFARSTTLSQIYACMIPQYAFPFSKEVLESANTMPTTLARARSLTGSDVDGLNYVKYKQSFDHHSVTQIGMEFDFADDISNGRGSFSLGSVPHVYSMSNLHTPTPSLVGEALTNRSIADENVHKVSLKEENDSVLLGTEHVALIDGLQWGLCHCGGLLLKVMYELLLAKVTHRDALHPPVAISHNIYLKSNETRASSNQISLHKTAVEQCLQIFLPAFTSDKTFAQKSKYTPHYSRIAIRNAECAQILFALALVLQGEVQMELLTSISTIVDSNPFNAALINRCEIGMSLIHFSKTSTERARNGFCHIFSQLLDHNISEVVLRSILRVAGTVYEFNIIELLSQYPLIPSGGMRQYVTDSETELDDAGCQMLYVLGLAVERPSPTVYVSFNQSSPFSSYLKFPSIEKIPQPKVGFSIFSWVRLGSIGNAPISTFMQLCVQSPTKEFKFDSIHSTIDVFFRCIHKTKVDHNSDIGNRNGNKSKRILQLCLSFRKGIDEVEESTESKLNQVFERDPADGTGAFDQVLGNALVKYLVPDVVVDFDWVELGNWHLLAITISAEGVQCYIDGEEKKCLFWSALGYVAHSISSLALSCPYPESLINSCYTELGKDEKLQITVGGILAEKYSYLSGIQYLSSQFSKNIDGSQDVKLSRELEVMQSFSNLVSGFSGFVGDLVLVENMPDSSVLRSLYRRGPNISLGSSFALNKLLLNFTPSNSAVTKLHSEEDVWKMVYPEDHVRGRRAFDFTNIDDESAHPKGPRRVSRSLSPTSPRFTDNSINRRSLSPNEDRNTEQAQQSTSLVSDLFTMFSAPVPVKDVLKLSTQTSSSATILYGSSKIHKITHLHEAFSRFGGLELWYPLLVIDRPHQVAALRILASVISSFQNAYDDFLSKSIEKVILYCLYTTPHLCSMSSMQVLFDLATKNIVMSDNMPHDSSLQHPEKISRIIFLQILVNIAVCSPRRIQLARNTIDWLIDLCDDSIENSKKVLDTFGVTPFLIILSLWSVTDVVQDLQKLNLDENKGKDKYYVALSPSSRTGDKEQSSPWNASMYRHFFSVHGTPLPAKLQKSATSLLHVLISGVVGEVPIATIVPSNSTQTGFSHNHLVILLDFILLVTRHKPQSFSDKEPNGKSSDDIRCIWQQRAAEQLLECLVNVSSGSIRSTILLMLRAALPGNSLWYFLIELLDNSLPAIRVHAIHLLGMSLSAFDGVQIDNKVVIQFETMQGFQCVAENLSKHPLDNESVLDALLNLMFWRRSGNRQGHSQNPPKLSSIDERKSFDSEHSEDNEKGGENLDYNNYDDNDIVLRPSINGELIEAQNFNNNGGNTFSFFNWINKGTSTAETAESKIRNILEVKENKDIEAGRNVIKPIQDDSKHKSNNSDENEKSRASSIDIPLLPQLLQAIFKIIQNEKLPQLVTWTIAHIENCICPISFKVTPNSNLIFNSEFYAAGVKNMEIVTNQKDWLCWVCECLLTFIRRSNLGTLGNNDMNELSGLESDDSMENSRRRNLSHRPANASPIISQSNDSLLAAFTDPIYNFVKSIFVLDIIGKPGSNRKMYDILRLPVPEASNVQLLILYDLLELFETVPLASIGPEQGVNLLRNISAFLEQVIEKVELPLDLSVKAVLVMNTLIYQAPPDLRSKIKDTLLPEMRNTFVTQCLIDRSNHLFDRIAALADIHTSVQNLLTSTETKTFQDTQILVILLDTLLETCNENNDGANLMENYGNSNDDESVSLPAGSLRGNQSQMFFDLQISAVLLIQNCIQAAPECKKLLNKLLSEMPDIFKSKNAIVLNGLSNSFGNDSLSRTCSPDEESKTKQLTSAPHSWWGYWGGTGEQNLSTSPPVKPGTRSDIETPDSLAENMPVSPTPSSSQYVDHESTSPVPVVSLSESLVSETTASHSNPFPTNIVSFVEWFTDTSQREYLEILNQKVTKLLQPIVRLIDKNHEKLIQRRSRFMRSLQEKIQKDVMLMTKAIKEVISKLMSANDKRCIKVLGDLNKYMTTLQQNIFRGRDEFKKTSDAMAKESTSNMIFKQLAYSALSNQGSCSTEINEDDSATEKVTSNASIINSSYPLTRLTASKFDDYLQALHEFSVHK